MFAKLKAFYTTVAHSVPPQTRNNSFRFQGGRLDVEWVVWLRKTKRTAHALRSKLNLPALWHRALAAHRKKEMHPGAAAISYKNVEWWEIMTSAGIGAHDQSWRHHKKNWVRGFEHVLSTVLGLGWWSEAKKCCRKIWQREKCVFVGEAVRHWGGPKLINKKYTLACLVPATDADVI